MATHDHYTRHILTEIERGPVTQRRLSKDLGIALGLTNLLIRRIVKKGWVKATSVKPNRVSYLITPTGLAEKTRITRAYFHNTIQLYTETRERIRESLNELSASWPEDAEPNGDREKRVVFYGAGEVAEIGYITLQGSDLQLVGIVDDRRRQPFFGLPVHSSSALRPGELNGQPFDRLIVTSLRKADQIRARLDLLGFPPDIVFWL